MGLCSVKTAADADHHGPLRSFTPESAAANLKQNVTDPNFYRSARVPVSHRIRSTSFAEEEPVDTLVPQHKPTAGNLGTNSLIFTKADLEKQRAIHKKKYGEKELQEIEDKGTPDQTSPHGTRRTIVKPSKQKSVEEEGLKTEEQVEEEAKGETQDFLCFNYGGYSKPGINFYGRHKVNQDRFVIIPNFVDRDDTMFFAVWDGHGLYGDLVSESAKTFLPEVLRDILRENKTDVIKEEHLVTAHERLQEEFKNRLDMDVEYSGTTSVVAVIQSNRIILANLGDSRCLLGYKKPDGKIGVKQLLFDQIPDVPSEKKMVEDGGGVVEAYMGGGPLRVWLPDYVQERPGLAMTRSLGDTAAHSVGVSATPLTKTIHVGRDMRCLVLCSDGMTEFLRNQEIVSFVSKYSNPQRASIDGVIHSRDRWQKSKKTKIVDDITLVTVFMTFESSLSDDAADAHKALCNQ